MENPCNIPINKIHTDDIQKEELVERDAGFEAFLPKSYSMSSLSQSVTQKSVSDLCFNTKKNIITSLSCTDIQKFQETHLIINESIEVVVEKGQQLIQTMPFINVNFIKQSSSQIDFIASYLGNECSATINFYSSNRKTIADFIRQGGDIVVFSTIFEFFLNQFTPQVGPTSAEEFIEFSKKLGVQKKRSASTYLSHLTQDDLNKKDIRAAISRLERVNDPIVKYNLSLLVVNYL